MKLRTYRTASLMMLALLSGLSPGMTLALDLEPNDSCASAQPLGAPVLPFENEAELGTSASDIDFFHIQAPPGDLVQFDLMGASSGRGSLGDPLLGIFDAAECFALIVDDESGIGSDARLVITIPASGELVVAATAFPDFSFATGGFGSYVLGVTRLGTIDSIALQVIDSETLAPLPGDMDPFANAGLIRCSDGDCTEFVSFQSADSDGRVVFRNDHLGNPLTTGQYAIQVSANGFDQSFISPFDVAEGEAFDAGVVSLNPMQFIGTVTGRIVDSSTGDPLPGNFEPYARVLVERCLESTFCFGVAFMFTDDQGEFTVDGRLFGMPPGEYRLAVMADNYVNAFSSIATIGNREDFHFGDVAITPVPIRLVNLTPCVLPEGGGSCTFAAEVVNVGPERFVGNAWAQIEFFSAAGPTTRYQVGRNGARNPDPLRVRVASGKSQNIAFKLDLPAAVPDGSLACGTIWLGSAPHAELNPEASQSAFCVLKTSAGLTTLPPQAARAMLHKRKQAEPQQRRR